MTTSTMMAANQLTPDQVIGTVSMAEFIVAVGATAGFMLALGSESIPLGPTVAGFDHVTPIGRARLVRAGGDVTVVAWGHTLSRVAELAGRLAEQGIEVEIVDLRWLDRASFDREAVLASVARTGGLVIAEDALRSFSVGSRTRAANATFESCTIASSASTRRRWRPTRAAPPGPTRLRMPEAGTTTVSPAWRASTDP